MNRPSAALIVLLLGVSAGAGVMWGLVGTKSGKNSTPESMVEVLIAARDLHPAVEIRDDDLFLIRMPERLVPPTGLSEPGAVVGRRPFERVLANELMREERLARADLARGVNATVPRGLRAVAVELGLGATPPAIGESVQLATRIDDEEDLLRVVPDALVVAVAERQSVIMVAVPSWQAERLVLAQQLGAMEVVVEDDGAWCRTVGECAGDRFTADKANDSSADSQICGWAMIIGEGCIPLKCDEN